MKRFLSILALAGLFAGHAAAQRLDITMTDDAVYSYNLDKIKYMEVRPAAEPGTIFGSWYLGYRIMSQTTTHYDGTEKWTFDGNRMTVKTSTKETVYNIEYSDNKKLFTAQEEGKTSKSSYSIIAYEEDVLVLKVGTITRYFYKSPNIAHEATLMSYPNRVEYTDTAKVWNLKGGSSHSTTSPMGNHYAKFPAATQEQIDWLADVKNQPDASFIDVSGFTSWTTKTINLYPLNGGNPTPADVNQHAIGDCCMCAVFASFAYIYPDFIKSIITKKTASSFVVKMYDPQGNPVDVAVDNKLLCKSNGECAQVSGKNGVFNWATIMEKALMKWLTCFRTQGLGGIGTEHAAPPFTGDGDSWSFSPDKLFNDEMKMVVDYALKNGMISVGGFNKGDLLCGTLTTVTGHAFTVMYTKSPDKYLFSMRNPWGITDVDGVLEIPNKRDIVRTIDFRLVSPGAAAPYKRQDLGGYILPKFVMGKEDRFLSPAMLKMYNLKSYGPETDIETEEEVEE